MGARKKMKRDSFGSTTYRGLTIEFVKEGGRVWARAPAWTRQYIGFGKTKAEALADAKKAIDNHYNPKGDVCKPKCEKCGSDMKPKRKRGDFQYWFCTKCGYQVGKWV